MMTKSTQYSGKEKELKDDIHQLLDISQIVLSEEESYH